MTHGVGWRFSKKFSFPAQMVWMLWCFEDLEEKDHSVNQSINHKAVCRRAPATPGLLITWQPLSLCVLLPDNIILDICINKNNTSVASNCKIILISHHWFKGYGNFPGWVKFAYWWSFIGGGSAISRVSGHIASSHIASSRGHCGWRQFDTLHIQAYCLHWNI